MNVFNIAGTRHAARCAAVAVFGLVLWSCAQESTTSSGAQRSPGANAPTSDTAQDDPQTFDGGDSSVSVSGTTVRIRLPADTSQLLPGPPLPLADGTACLACHDRGEVVEFTSMPEGPNYEVTNEFCRDCHSADYISTQPPLNAAAWQKVVTKMVDKFDPDAATGANGAEPGLNPEHQKLMVDYLVATYGQ